VLKETRNIQMKSSVLSVAHFHVGTCAVMAWHSVWSYLSSIAPDTAAFISLPGLGTVGEWSWVFPSLAELSIKISIGLAGTVQFGFISRGLQLHILG
jgi:hypothetical protein